MKTLHWPPPTWICSYLLLQPAARFMDLRRKTAIGQRTVKKVNVCVESTTQYVPRVSNAFQYIFYWSLVQAIGNRLLGWHLANPRGIFTVGYHFARGFHPDTHYSLSTFLITIGPFGATRIPAASCRKLDDVSLNMYILFSRGGAKHQISCNSEIDQITYQNECWKRFEVSSLFKKFREEYCTESSPKKFPSWYRTSEFWNRGKNFPM